MKFNSPFLIICTSTHNDPKTGDEVNQTEHILKFSFWHTSKCSIGGHNRHYWETSCPGDTDIRSTENGPKVLSKPSTLPVSRMQFNHPFLIIRTCTHIDPETKRMKRTKTGQKSPQHFLPWWHAHDLFPHDDMHTHSQCSRKKVLEKKWMQRQGFAVTKVLSWYDLLYMFQIS